MGLTNKFLAKSVLVKGNFLAIKKSKREEKIYLQQVNDEKVKAGG